MGPCRGPGLDGAVTPRFPLPSLSAIVKIVPLEAIVHNTATGCNDTSLSGPAAQKSGAELLKKDEALKKQMFYTFNMGIGFVLAIAPTDIRQAVEHLDDMGFPAWDVGQVKAAGTNAAKGELRFA